MKKAKYHDMLAALPAIIDWIDANGEITSAEASELLGVEPVAAKGILVKAACQRLLIERRGKFQKPESRQIPNTGDSMKINYDIPALASALRRMLSDDNIGRVAIDETRGVASHDPPGSHKCTVAQLFHDLVSDETYREVVQRPHDLSQLKTMLKSGEVLVELHHAYGVIVDVNGAHVKICRVGWKSS